MRVYELIISNPIEDKNFIRSEGVPNYDNSNVSTPKPLPDDGTSTIAPNLVSLRLSELQMKADINYFMSGENGKSQPCTIEIYNPSGFTEDYLKIGNTVILKAGYDDAKNLPVIAVTQVQKVEVTNKGVDKIYKLSCIEAYTMRDSVYYRRTYVKGTPWSIILGDFLLAYSYYGVPTALNLIPSKFRDASIKKAKTFDGSLNTVFTNFCNEISARWHTAGGQMYVFPQDNAEMEGRFKDSSFDDNITVNAYAEEIPDLITMIDIDPNETKKSLQPLNDSSNKTKKEKESTDISGLKVELFLTPDAQYAQYARVLSGQYAGDYRIRSVKHKLDYEGNAWDTTLELEV